MASASRASSSTSRQGPQTPFLRAVIYAPDIKAYSKPQQAWFSISSSVRWKYIDTDDDSPPYVLTDFRGHFCLSLERLNANAKWDDVENTVRVLDKDGKPALTVSGTLSRRIKTFLRSRQVQVTIVAEKKRERDAWATFLRNRVAPWQLLYQRSQQLFRDSRLTPADLESVFSWLEKVPIPAVPIIGSGDGSEEPMSQVAGGFVFDAINSISNLVETVAIGVRTYAPVVSESVELVGDLAKCVTVVGAAFQVVALFATVVELCEEKKRGADELPRIRLKLEQLHGAILKSMVPILHPDHGVDDELLKHMFRVQEQVSSNLCDVECQMMREGVRGLLRAGELKKIESAMKTLEDRVVAVVQSKNIAENTAACAANRGAIDRQDNKISKLASGVEVLKQNARFGRAVLRHPPSLTPYFVGRQGELDQLKKMLDKYGSSAIMQVGGAGKTQLMIAFGERAKKNKWIHGGCYWVPANGNKEEFMERLANFAEALAGENLKVEERADVNAVVSVIKRKLSSSDSKWLLCLDNADDKTINGVVGELCRIANPQSCNGWVLVTTRQGGVPMWSGMNDGQKLKLESLSTNDAMLVLVRWKMARQNKTSDSDAMAEIERLRVEDNPEYEAISELAGQDTVYGLGGLALALAQAGSYVSHKGMSFVKYLRFYKEVRQSSEVSVSVLFNEIEDSGFVPEEQRNVWTTWKINVDGLSVRARHVLRAFALLDSTPVPEVLVKHLDSRFIDHEFEYFRYVSEELVNGASLLDRLETADGVEFVMHHLVREFVILETKTDKAQHDTALMHAVSGVHELVRNHVLKMGNFVDCSPKVWSVYSYMGSKSVYPNMFRDSGIRSVTNFIKRTLVGNAAKLVQEFCDSPFLATKVSWIDKLMFVFRFATRACSYLRKAENICESMMQKLRNEVGIDSDHDLVASVLHDQGIQKFKEKLNGLKNPRSTSNNASNKKEVVKYDTELFTRSVDMLRRLYGKCCDHPEVVASFLQLGAIALRNGDLVDAEHYFRSSLEMTRRLQGNDVVSWDVSATLFCLAALHALRDDHCSAACLFRESHSMRRKLAHSYPCFTRDLNDLYVLLNQARVTEDCIDLEIFVPECLSMKKYAEIDEGDNCIHVAMLLQKLAKFCLEKDEISKAKGVFMEALESYGKVRIDHKYYDGTYSAAMFLSPKFSCFEAYRSYREMYAEFIEICRQLFERHVDHIGFAFVSLCRTMSVVSANREKEYRSILSIMRRVIGKETDNEFVSLCLFVLASEVRKRGDLDEAETLLLECVDMNRRIYIEPIGSHEIFSSIRELAEVLGEKGLFAESKCLLLESHEMAKRYPRARLLRCSEVRDLYSLALKAKEAGVWEFVEVVLMDCTALARESDILLDVAILLLELSNCFMELGKYGEAKETFEEYLNVNESVSSLFETKSFHHEIDKDRLFGQFWALQQRVFEGKDHMSIAKIFHYRAIDAHKKKELSTAALLLRESLAMKRRILGTEEDDASISFTIRALANVFKDDSWLV